MGADKAGAELDSAGTHFEIGSDHLAGADAAGDEDRQLLGNLRQDFLGQHRGRDRPDMAARFHALNDNGVDTGADEFLRQRHRGGKADHFRAGGLDRFQTALGWQAAGEHDMSHGMFAADRDQLHQVGMHGDQIDAERLFGAFLGLGDFGVEQFRRHRAAGNHAKAAGVGNRADQMAFGYPGHRPAHDRGLAAEKIGAALHEMLECGLGHGISF